MGHPLSARCNQLDAARYGGPTFDERIVRDEPVKRQCRGQARQHGPPLF